MNKTSNCLIYYIYILLTSLSLQAQNPSSPSTDYLTGSGTVNFHSKWTGGTALGNSSLFEDASGRIGLGTTLPSSKFEINTDVSFQQPALKISSYHCGLYINLNTAGYGIIQDGPDGNGKNYFKYSIGIGTSTPAYRLDVKGNTAIEDKFVIREVNESKGVEINSRLTDWDHHLDFTLSVGNSDALPFQIYRTGVNVDGLITTRQFCLKDNAADGKVLVSNENGVGRWTDPDVFTDDYWMPNGKDIYTLAPHVGIGTSTPRSKLEIKKDDNGPYTVILNKTKYGDSATFCNEIRFDSMGTERWSIGHSYRQGTKNQFFIWNHFRFRTALYIDGKEGKVGIETEYPNAKLDVNGSFIALSAGIGCSAPSITGQWRLYVDGGIKAREIKVTVSSFADYVFDESYSLLPLGDLETFIKVNKHLPGIPSSAEVEKNEGIELGSMQTKLLEKVEEQSLYIIQLQKQIDELRDMINQDKSK